MVSPQMDEKSLRSSHEAPWCNVVHPRVWAGPGWDALVSQGAPWEAKMHPMPFWFKILKEILNLTHPPAPCGPRLLPAKSSRGGQGAWQEHERACKAVIRVLLLAVAFGVPAWSARRFRYWPQEGAPPLALALSDMHWLPGLATAAAVFPLRRGWVCPPCWPKGWLQEASGDGGAPAHHRCVAGRTFCAPR